MKKSVTLIELTLVIVIILILSVVALLAFINFRGDANRAACIADTKTIDAALNNWNARWSMDGTCPSGDANDCAVSGYPAPEQLQADTTYFARNYFTHRRLPLTRHILGGGTDWSVYYDSTNGVIEVNAACP